MLIPAQNILTVSKFSTGKGPWALLTPEIAMMLAGTAFSCHNHNYRDHAWARTSFLWEWLTTEVVESPSLQMFKHWIQPWGMCSGDSGFSREAGLDGLPLSLPTITIPGFCSVMAVVWTTADLHPGLAKFASLSTMVSTVNGPQKILVVLKQLLASKWFLKFGEWFVNLIPCCSWKEGSACQCWETGLH